jgi:uncharacterized membrane protein YsdA (DUF1294 family)
MYASGRKKAAAAGKEQKVKTVLLLYFFSAAAAPVLPLAITDKVTRKKKTIPYFCIPMIKNFFHFKEVSVLGIDHLRDPATILTNILLFAVGFWCYKRISKFRSGSNPGVQIEASGWSSFFLCGSIAYLIGVAVHGFSWYIPEKVHFVIWLVMGWMQILAASFAQFATAKRYFPEHLIWIRVLMIIQFFFFCALMAIIGKFGAVNIDVAIALVPVACWHIYLHSKKRLASPLVGWGILFAGLAGLAVVFKLMPSLWFSFNDVAHVILMGSLLIICSGLERNFSAVEGSPQ